jgi:hypothetical protein
MSSYYSDRNLLDLSGPQLEDVLRAEEDQRNYPRHYFHNSQSNTSRGPSQNSLLASLARLLPQQQHQQQPPLYPAAAAAAHGGTVDAFSPRDAADPYLRVLKQIKKMLTWVVFLLVAILLHSVQQGSGITLSRSHHPYSPSLAPIQLPRPPA